MAVRFEDRSGTTVLVLPPTMRSEGEDVSQRLPMLSVPRRWGAVLSLDDVQLEPRTLIVSGKVAADSPEALEAMYRDWSGRLTGRLLRMYSRDDAQRFIEVVASRLNKTNVEGSGGMAAEIRIDLQAPEPLWWARDAVRVDWSPTASGQTTTVQSPGSWPAAPVITIYGATVSGKHLVNPRLVNESTGHVLELALNLQQGQAVRVYPVHAGLDEIPEEAAAYQYAGTMAEHVPWTEPLPSPVSVLTAVGEEWTFDGFWLVQGENVIRFEDDPTGCHQATVVLEWRPAWA